MPLPPLQSYSTALPLPRRVWFFIARCVSARLPSPHHPPPRRYAYEEFNPYLFIKMLPLYASVAPRLPRIVLPKKVRFHVVGVECSCSPRSTKGTTQYWHAHSYPAESSVPG